VAAVLGAAVSVRVATAALAALLAAPQAHAELYYLIVAGIGGQSKYDEQFKTQAEQLAAAGPRTPGDAGRVDVLIGEQATRESVRERLESLATRAKPADSVAIFLLGHGSHDGERYKLNLPGPDLDGEELAQLFAGIQAGSQLIVN